MSKNTESLLSKIDVVDDLIYKFYQRYNHEFLIKNPQYRFLQLNLILGELCAFNLNDDFRNHELYDKIVHKEDDISKQIGKRIKSLIKTPTYFAASYWSPVDSKRHTISYNNKSKSLSDEKSRASALLFYLITNTAPDRFHSAINFISLKAPSKDGLHSYYKINTPDENFQYWWHFPREKRFWKDGHLLKRNIHNDFLTESGFLSALNALEKYSSEEIKESLQIIMENTDEERVDDEIMKYKTIFEPIFEKFDTFQIPSYLNNTTDDLSYNLHRFFNSKSLKKINTKVELTKKQVFFMACTHALYDKACPTDMFYTFPVRVSDTCCVLTLGVKNKLEHENIMAMFHIVKSIYHHALDLDYQSLNDIERHRLAHGSMHIMKQPLHSIRNYPKRIKNILKDKIEPVQFEYISELLSASFIEYHKSIRKFNAGLDTLVKFIDVTPPQIIDLKNLITKVNEDFRIYFFDELEGIELDFKNDVNLCIYGKESVLKFIFGEILYNCLKINLTERMNKEEKKPLLKIKYKIYKTSEKKAIVEIVDNGPGVANENKRRIFKSTYQNSQFGGSGMGLYLAQIYLNRMNGSIIENGEHGKYARFIITLTLHETENTNS